MTRPPIVPAATSVAAFVGVASDGPTHAPVAIGSLAEFTQTFSADSSPLEAAMALFFANGGTTAYVVRVGGAGAGDEAVSAPGLEAQRQGLWALAGTPFNVLCVPPYAAGTSADVSARTRQAAVALCRAHRAIYFADPLASWTTADAVVSGVRDPGWGLAPDPDAALYWPFLSVNAPAGGTTVMPASAAVAGLVARIDRTRGVWKAPAGKEAGITGAAGLAITAKPAEQERLNRSGINVLRTFRAAGPTVWGARTLMGADSQASEWKYIPVRRLGLFIESSIDGGTGWTAEEPNGEPLWKDLRTAVSAFLQGLFAAGALAGPSPREAYFVKCDAATTTAVDIAAGRVRIIVGFAPLRPAEFVLLELVRAAKRPPPP